MSVIAVSVMGCLFFYAMLGIKEKRRNWNNTPVIIYSYIYIICHTPLIFYVSILAFLATMPSNLSFLTTTPTPNSFQKEILPKL